MDIFQYSKSYQLKLEFLLLYKTNVFLCVEMNSIRETNKRENDILKRDQQKNGRHVL